jgi:DNA polymerase III delta prime subunit
LGTGGRMKDKIYEYAINYVKEGCLISVPRGVGKTNCALKLANYFLKQNKRVEIFFHSENKKRINSERFISLYGRNDNIMFRIYPTINPGFWADIRIFDDCNRYKNGINEKEIHLNTLPFNEWIQRLELEGLE